MRQPNSLESHQHREEEIERKGLRRAQKQFFDELEYRITHQETEDQRDVRLFYNNQNARPCECGEPLGMHDWPDGPCMAPGSTCRKFQAADRRAA